MNRRLIGRFALAMTMLAFPMLEPRPAAAAPKTASAQQATPSSDLSAQRRRVRRAPLRIRVYPRGIPEVGRSGPRLDPYPRPYPYEWPGPNAQRECVTWLAPEARLTGTVIVPRRRCWWISG